ncbi:MULTISPECIES: hypothetical protein [Acinetobacter]|uniref:hypothetical protein n=1 Tax=Acinetobacter TaxID=469 RepID=UPI00103924D4|nr:hypothetical protein [Acinetobacter sp. ANC 3781]TCB77629.1 hypothetical protein E0H89_08495 [Acinetobacter sp. ANC 3781]
MTTSEHSPEIVQNDMIQNVQQLQQQEQQQQQTGSVDWTSGVDVIGLASDVISLASDVIETVSDSLGSIDLSL